MTTPKMLPPGEFGGVGGTTLNPFRYDFVQLLVTLSHLKIKSYKMYR